MKELLLPLLLAPAIAFAAVDLDYMWLFGGTTYVPLDGAAITGGTYSTCGGVDAVAQPDGKVLVAGVCDLVNYPYGQDGAGSLSGVATVLRVNADGTLDTTFGDAPWPASAPYPAIPGFQFLAAGAYAVGGAVSLALRADGRVVIGGSISDATRFGAKSIAVAQLMPDGSFDAGFANGGISIQHFTAYLDDDNLLRRIALDAQGNIAVAANYYAHGMAATQDSDFLVGTIAANGTSAELQRFPFDLGGTLADTAADLAIDSHGRYVVLGTVTPASGVEECGVLRVNAAPLALDDSFGSGGRQTLSFEAGNLQDDCVSLAVRSDDGLVLAANVAGSSVGVAALDGSGQFDAAFGRRLLGTLPQTTNVLSVARVSIEPWDGRIVLAASGTAYAAGCFDCEIDFGLVRLNGDGSVDSGFTTTTPGSTFGALSIDFGPENPATVSSYGFEDGASAVVFSGHSLVVAGVSRARSANPSYLEPSRFAVTRLSTDDIYRGDFDGLPYGVACRREATGLQDFPGLLAHSFDGLSVCIPPVTINASGVGDAQLCATSTCGASTPGCPAVLHAQAGSAAYVIDGGLPVPAASLELSAMPAQIDAFDAPLQFSVFGFPQSCIVTFSGTAFDFGATAGLATDHQWGGFPTAVTGASIGSFTSTVTGCDPYGSLINAAIDTYRQAITPFLQSTVTQQLGNAAAGHDVCQR